MNNCLKENIDTTNKVFFNTMAEEDCKNKKFLEDKSSLEYMLFQYEHNGPMSDREMIIPATYIHLQNQIVNYKSFYEKYPMNFDYLTASAIYVSKLIEENPSIAQEIHKIKIRKVRAE